MAVVPPPASTDTPVVASMTVTPEDRPLGENSQSKNAAKKALKLAEAAAKKAAKSTSASIAASTGISLRAEKKKEKKPAAALQEWVNKTPKGQKKDVSGDLPATGYDPIQVEAAHYDWWNAKGFFKPRYQADGSPLPAGVFSITLPPPNVTGQLHIGHALTVAIEDCMVRWKRMKGFTVLWLPGYDHAGISTQAVVENRLIKTEGKSRHDYGREKFLERVFEWKEDYQGRITAQMERLGASVDWSRVAFTMSEPLSKAVAETFCTLHERGLLYRANRLVNWCVYMNTSLSNLEVDQLNLTGRTMMAVKGYDPKEKFEFGVLTSFAYPIEDSDERIIIATTRPETMLGDTAIAVHPDDSRYKHLHGKFAIHPFLDRRIPIITDPIAVDMAFGTGAVKITPAHDQNDFECAVRNNLEFINLMNDDGTYNENAGPYKGMKRFHVRNAVIRDLKEKGLYIDSKDNEMAIPICSKSGDVIESIMKPQWWVSCKPMAEEALQRTRAGELVIKPKTSANEFTQWMEQMQDWCISRQLWWGHRCPAYLLKIDGEMTDVSADDSWIVARSLAEAEDKAKLKAAGRSYTLSQDEDVLDTWFSAGLWPFSTMGWPDKTADMDLFYPNTILETGWDIIFFWVARMVFFGNALTGKMPFKEVYCHPMIRDAFGRKMSKSLGNVIDPLDVITGQTLQKLHADLRIGNLPENEIIKAEEGQKKLFPRGIPQCGTDALRFALCNYTSGGKSYCELADGVGRDINMEINRVEGYRKFCNKLWNATKFCLFRMGLVELDGTRIASTFTPRATGLPTGQESLAERWLLHKFSLASAMVNDALEKREFSLASSAAHDFVLYDLCDVFIEATKPLFETNQESTAKLSAQNTLYTAIEGGLRLLHPFMPYVTEDLWQRLPRRSGDTCESIMISAFPEWIPEQDFPQALADFDLVNLVIRAARSISGSYNLPTNGKTLDDKFTVIIQAKSLDVREMLLGQEAIMIALTHGAGQARFIGADEEVPVGCGSEVVSAGIKVYIPVQGKIDAAAEIDKLEKKAALNQANKDKVQKAMSVAGYETVVKEHVREGNSNKMALLEAEVESLTLAIERFKLLL